MVDKEPHSGETEIITPRTPTDMATVTPQQNGLSADASGVNGVNNTGDPFTINETPTRPSRSLLRHSSFDTQLFALNHPSSSPAQAKRALEEHLAETDRRIQETSKLGTTLVQQRSSLNQRIRDVETHGERETITPELREKLKQIEREYQEIGRQSAKVFLGPRAGSPVAGEPSNAFALDGRVRAPEALMQSIADRHAEHSQSYQVLKPGYRFTIEGSSPKEAAKSSVKQRQP